ncbi:acyltransferase [Pseudomonas nitroreducens]|uniref:acyltransferase family protein n=1 Tax=Pseudomonas nitroreducens TaxID=46680 RepID=UPI0024497F85|nr:acyltransferase [Pseudomonas nitroreducens]MDH1071477.1 acyltransferase [Pseudomonas nitroreducens]
MRQKIADIQVLRAIAVILVISYHAPLYLIHWRLPALERFSAYFGGNAGIDLLFVISGFVIARTLLERAQGTEPQSFIFFEFWTRRFFRIAPAAGFWLLVTLLLTLFLNQSGAFGSVQAAAAGSLAAILQAANIHLAECQGHVECSATQVYWSLSLQSQFYLIFPVLAALAGHRLASVLALFVLSQCLVPWLMLPSHFRATGFAIGALMACFARAATYRSFEPTLLEQLPWLRNVVLGFLLLGLASATAPGLHIVSGNLGYNLLAFLSAALVFMASFDRQYILLDGRLKRLLVWIGDRSYALYLTHMPAFFLTRELFHRLAPDLTGNSTAMLSYLGCAGMLTIALSELSFRFIEVPLQRRGAQWLALRRQQEFGQPNGTHHAQQTT